MDFAERNHTTLIHYVKLPASFNIGRWWRGYNKVVLTKRIFVSEKLANQCYKFAMISNRNFNMCQIHAEVKPRIVIFHRLFNFNKIRWNEFSKTIGDKIKHLFNQYLSFMNILLLVQNIQRRTIGDVEKLHSRIKKKFSKRFKGLTERFIINLRARRRP